MFLLTIGIAFFLYGCATVPGGEAQAQKRVYGGLVVDEKSPERKDKLVLTDAEWQKRLTPEQYKILRNKGTEAAFCSPLNDVKKPGVFHCAGCDLELFSTEAKFTSGTGWPSFFQPVKRENVWLKSDFSYGMDRVEVLCSRCDGHLGHVFNDGPRDKTGNRFCINGESLKFKEKKSD
jgi:methionine-R-sulfoxide reductase